MTGKPELSEKPEWPDWSLRQYIDGMMNPASLGDADKFAAWIIVHFRFCGIFWSGQHRLLMEDSLVHLSERYISGLSRARQVSLEKLYIQSEELGPMQRKSHLKNYNKLMYVSGMWYRPVPLVEVTQRYFHREGSVLKHMLSNVHIGTCKQLIGRLPILLLTHPGMYHF